MHILARLLVAATDLLEAEGRAIRRGVMNVVSAMVAAVVALAFLVTGVVLVLWGVYRLIAAPLGAGVAGVIIGGGGLLLGLLIFVIARTVSR